MHDGMMKNMKEKMGPAAELVDINKKAAETLISLQSEYFTDFFNASLAQVKALLEVKEPKAALDLQIKFFKDLEGKMTSVAEKEMLALTEAKEQAAAIVEKNFSGMGEWLPTYFDMTKYMPEAKEVVESEAPIVKAAPKAKVAPKTQAAPKPKAAPKVKAAPRPKAAPKAKAVPKAQVAPEVKAAPEAQVAPEIKAAPVAQVAPEVKAAQEAQVAPEVKTAPEASVVEEVKTVPEAPVVQAAPAEPGQNG